MKKIFSILCLLLFTLPVLAQDFDPAQLLKKAPNTPQLVNDYTSTLTVDQQEVLEQKLVAFDKSTTTQVAVVIVPTINDNEIADYGVKLFRAWGIGTKKNNNGVLLLIVKLDHQLNITTGYGVEGALPDITCKHIIDDVIVPQLKSQDFYAGIDAGTDAIMQAVKGEYTAPESTTTPHKYPLIVRILFWIIGIIIVLFLAAKGWLWPILNIVSSIAFSSSGSSSGGGFGGFGGGSSGGGGASGSW